jgi:predicted P-loop ATPase
VTFPFTKFDNLQGFTLTLEDIEVDRLKEVIETTAAPVKEQLPSGKLATFGTLPSPPDANGKGGGSLRWDGNVVAVSGIEGDYDGEQMPLAEARDRLNIAGLVFVIHTTGRHTPQKPRWRVWLPFSKLLPATERPRMVDRLNGVLGGVLANESWTLSQAFFIGRVDGVPFEIAIGDGEEFIDDAEELDKIRRGRPGGKTSKTGKGGKSDLKNLSEEELEEEFPNSRFHVSARLLWIWALQEMSKADAQANLEALFDNVPQADRDTKWATYRRAIPQWVDKIYARAAKHLGTFLAKLVTHFKEDALWHGALRYSEFTQTIEVSSPFPPLPGQVLDVFRALRETDTLRALIAVQGKDFPKATFTDVWRAIILAAEDQSYHPVREYLDGLVWDRAPRIHQLFFDYFPGELPEEEYRGHLKPGELSWRDRWAAYYEHTARCFMIGAVARILEPGCKVDSLPIFVSEQRYYKGLGLQALVGDPKWYTDDIPIDVADKDTKDALVGKWIVELSETPHLKREVERFKAFVSRTTDRYRRPFERLTQDWPRQTALTGTSNNLTYLDVTGNRRYWAIPLADRANVALIKRDRDQLWAEAVHLYRNKTPWWLSEELEDIAAEIQAGYVEEDILDGSIRKWVELRRSHKTGKVTPFELSELCAGLAGELGLGSRLVMNAGSAPTIASKSDQARVQSRLHRLGFRRKRVRVGGRYPWLWFANAKKVPERE